MSISTIVDIQNFANNYITGAGIAARRDAAARNLGYRRQGFYVCWMLRSILWYVPSPKTRIVMLPPSRGALSASAIVGFCGGKIGENQGIYQGQETLTSPTDISYLPLKSIVKNLYILIKLSYWQVYDTPLNNFSVSLLLYRQQLKHITLLNPESNHLLLTWH